MSRLHKPTCPSTIDFRFTRQEQIFAHSKPAVRTRLNKMKPLSIFVTACASLAIATPILNPRQGADIIMLCDELGLDIVTECRSQAKDCLSLDRAKGSPLFMDCLNEKNSGKKQQTPTEKKHEQAQQQELKQKRSGVVGRECSIPDNDCGDGFICSACLPGRSRCNPDLFGRCQPKEM